MGADTANSFTQAVPVAFVRGDVSLVTANVRFEQPALIVTHEGSTDVVALVSELGPRGRQVCGAGVPGNLDLPQRRTDRGVEASVYPARYRRSSPMASSSSSDRTAAGDASHCSYADSASASET